MLNTVEAAALLAVIREERSFESHVLTFNSTFRGHQHFKACCCLLFLLEVRCVHSGTPAHICHCLVFTACDNVVRVLKNSTFI